MRNARNELETAAIPNIRTVQHSVSAQNPSLLTRRKGRLRALRLPRLTCQQERSFTARRVRTPAELDSAPWTNPCAWWTKRDGKPLPDKDCPFQLVVPGEKRAARWGFGR